MGRMSITRTSNVNLNFISSQRLLKRQAYSSISQGPRAGLFKQSLNSDTSNREDFTVSLPKMELPALLVAKQSRIVWDSLTQGLARVGKGGGGKTCCKRVIFLAEGPCREIPECCFQSEKLFTLSDRLVAARIILGNAHSKYTVKYAHGQIQMFSVKCSTL